MLEISIPGRERLRLVHLVCDLNGTLARDGITAATHGQLDVTRTTLADVLRSLAPGSSAAAPIDLVRLIATGDDKHAIINDLGPEQVVALGNGINDVAMLRSAAPGIAICGSEGMASAIVQAADVICTDPRDALDLLRYPARLVATLRA